MKDVTISDRECYFIDKLSKKIYEDWTNHDADILLT